MAITLNALDRIIGYYQPTDNMPGKNLQGLMQGLTYNENIYKGNPFTPEDAREIDVEIKDQPYYPKEIDIKAVLYDGYRYIAVGNSPTTTVVMISTDGVNWDIKTLSEQIIAVTDIAYSGDMYLITTATFNTPVYSSHDGENWVTTGPFTPYDDTNYDEASFDTSSSDLANALLYSDIYAKGLFVATGSGEIVNSVDGLVWTKVFQYGGRTEKIFKDITYAELPNYKGFIVVGGGQEIIGNMNTAFPTFVAIAMVILSPDGMVWSPIDPRVTDTTMNGVAASPTIIIMVGDAGKIFASINGSNWNGCFSGVSVNLNRIVYGNSLFVVIGNSGTILTSPNGITWTARTSNTTNNLNSIHFNGTSYIVVGENSTILKSIDGLVWEDISYINTKDTTYRIVGSEFSYGYSPEELVSGVITDSLVMFVKTRPGSAWDPVQYGYVGFNMNSKVATLDRNNSASFDHLVDVLATISVYIVDSATLLGQRIYSGYTIDWVKKIITLDDPILSTQSVLIEAYEVGGGNQIIKDCTDNIPLRTDSITGQAEIYLGYNYDSTIYATPVCYLNGTKLIFNTDYIIKSTGTGTAKIMFSTAYDSATSYFSFAVLGPANIAGYSVPETEVYTSTGTGTYTLHNFAGYANPTNAIVEVDGLRLTPAQYSITGTSITVTASNPTGSKVAVTTFNDTRLQTLVTETKVATAKVTPIFYVDRSSSVIYIVTDSDPGFSNGDHVRISGTKGSTQLNDKLFYVKPSSTYVSGGVTYYPFQIYTNDVMTAYVQSRLVSMFDSGGYVWKESATFQVTQPEPMTDGSRTWVTVDGKKVAPSQLYFNDSNTLSIAAPIEIGQTIVVTSMVSTPTPNELVYNVNMDKSGNSTVYRANNNTSTWLTQPFDITQNVIYVADVTRLVDTLVQPSTVEMINGTPTSKIQCDLSSVCEISIYNVTTLTYLSPSSYTWKAIDGVPCVVYSNEVAIGESVEVTIRSGQVLMINSERIKFSAINHATNTISNLIRGVQGTGAQKKHDLYTVVNSLLPGNLLDSSYYNQTWNSTYYDATLGDPLQVSTTVAAKFLKYGSV